MIAFQNNAPVMPCTNSKFMHIAGLPGMRTVESYNTYSNESITSVYRGNDAIAERVITAGRGKGSVSCFIFKSAKGIVNA
ncbi:hypothetical protein PHYNN_74 [Pantoea phage Phynn]|nr:hypothetical protein PHYNN_74 [Pantoea phage Phynn]